MRVGIVSVWFNRGQATVARHLRSALETTGHETRVLARPTQASFYLPDHIDSADVWSQNGVTRASHYQIPLDEYLDWAAAEQLDAVMFDQNYQFDAIAELRGKGVRTIGRFVWESFADQHVQPALRAFDTIYSLTRCERERYARLGIESRSVRWGCHPELVERRPVEQRERLTLFYPGGYLSQRKPTAAVVEAFRQAQLPDVQLIIKAQRPLCRYDLVVPDDLEGLQVMRRAPVMAAEVHDLKDVAGIDIVSDDLDTDAYYELFASCHVMVAPSRWEGLGLHLYEATAFGLPALVNDMAPLNEVVRHGDNGLLSSDHTIGTRPNGLACHEPDLDELITTMRRVSRPETRQALIEGTRRRRDELDWQHTLEDLALLLER